MSEKFGIPPTAEHVSSVVADRLEQARTEDGAKITAEFRGEQKHLHVISMPVDLLYFNPDTHRIRAQRSLDPERNRVLEEEPWSQKAQDYLRDLLKCQPSNPDQTDPDYTQLMDELDDNGQREPGIITPSGILVDGNTRCAAMTELGVKNIRVGVLPESTSRRDINDVEMALQLRHDKRRDYSYINQLLAIEDELARGRREEDVARDFNIKPKTLRTDRRVLQMVKDALERSTTADGARLRLVDFEGHQEKLRELQRDYMTLAETDPEAAEMLKESRLAMVVLNYSKTSMRLAEADFYERYLDSRLSAELRPKAADPVDMAVPGLEDVVVSDAGQPVRTVKALTDLLLQAKAATGPGSKLGNPEVAAADKALQSARNTYDTAVKLAGQNAELQKKKTAVPERLTDAAEYVSQCAAEFAEAKSKRVLDEDAFDDALLTLRNSLFQLAKLAGRAFDSPGDGVAWLLDAARDR